LGTAHIHPEVKLAPFIRADETGLGRCGKDRMWLRAAAGGDAEAFRLLPGRGRAQVEDLFGQDFKGILHRGRWKPYETLEKVIHQICHNHIRRDFQSMLESTGETGARGCMLKLASDQAFHLWHQFEREGISRKQLVRRTKPIQAEVRQWLDILWDGPDITQKARGTAKDLMRQWESIWTYLYHDGAVPSNNEAERTIRKAVLGCGQPGGCPFRGAHADRGQYRPPPGNRPPGLACPDPPNKAGWRSCASVPGDLKPTP
jgi:transposase